jgi:hypothetical protein
MSLDFFDHYRLREIQRSVDHLRKAATTPNPFAPKQADIETLQQEVGELRLLVAVLYRLLLTKGEISDTEVHAMISSLDASDGNRDGRFAGDAVSGNPQVAPPADDNPMPKIRVS